jgi:hypothetical protein
MFHKSNLGSFGERLPSDMNGFVPESGDGPWDFCIDHGTEKTHADGELTAYGRWWELEGFPEWRDAAVAASDRNSVELDRWRCE